jgi:hypothetical protein
MAVSFSHDCLKCKSRDEVFIDEPNTPSMNSPFVYTCSNGHKVRAHPTAFTVDVTIPENAIVGHRPRPGDCGQ